ncbi:MAG: inner membrane CreD family protein [Sinobacteraceae bacterium]|nr:inner membrane CreD family protein [Nevskiaceae bacterium]
MPNSNGITSALCAPHYAVAPAGPSARAAPCRAAGWLRYQQDLCEDTNLGFPRFTTDSVLTKGAVIGLLTLLLWPLGQVAGLVSEREAMREAARTTIAKRVGAQQWIAGPVPRIPVQRRRPVAMQIRRSAGNGGCPPHHGWIRPAGCDRPSSRPRSNAAPAASIAPFAPA